MAKRQKKKQYGSLVFRLIAIELSIIVIVMLVGVGMYLPKVMGVLKALKQEQEIPIFQGNSNSLQQPENPVVTQPIQEEETKTEPVTEKDYSNEVYQSEITLSAVGDNVMYRSSTLSGKQVDGTYSFYSHFCNVQAMLEAADIAILSQATVMAGEEYGVTNGNSFTTVTQLGEGIVNAGIDVVLAANDHILDMGSDGLNNMINYWRANYPDMKVLGVNQTEQQKSELVFTEVNGITLAMINYTCSSNVTTALEQAPYLVNRWDEAWIAQMIDRAKTEADFVIVFPHWGSENSIEITQEQQEQAQKMCDLGADLIIGTHPGVVQPVKWLTGANGKETLVYYSLGNFQSLQEQTANMLGALSEITITKTSERTYISDYDMDFLVTHYAQEKTNEYFDVVTTFPWKLYNQELASKHGILAWDPEFSYEKLDELRKQVLANSEL